MHEDDEDATSVAIIFEKHATSLDNERHLASGHYDVGLSVLGKQEAEDLGRRYADETFAAIYCPDHRRAIDTAAIAFGARDMPIIHDQRLRECDYGAMTRFPLADVEREAPPRHGALSAGRKLLPSGNAHGRVSPRRGH
jgi:broad specificity phosphatase PhoE